MRVKQLRRRQKESERGRRRKKKEQGKKERRMETVMTVTRYCVLAVASFYL
jgi:hypothetical protein